MCKHICDIIKTMKSKREILAGYFLDMDCIDLIRAFTGGENIYSNNNKNPFYK